MRVAMLGVVVCCMVDYMHAVFTQGFWKPDIEVIGMLLGVLGLKGWQKFAEREPKKTIAKRVRRRRVVAAVPAAQVPQSPQAGGPQ